MFRRVLRAPYSFPRLSRQTRWTILILSLAAFVEVYIHTRNYAVRQPHDHDLDTPFYTSCQEPKINAPREKAALVMLARNKELDKALKTVNSIERHFNQYFHYPIIFINDQPWSEEFIRVMNATVSGEARFEVLEKEEWTFPEWMDEKAAKESIAAQGRAGIIYAGLETYHHMCRFYSGKFYTLKALKDYKWYWRIEPDVDFYCTISYDPFVEMAKHDKVYGFTIGLPEESRTCPTLFREMSDWKEKHGIRTTELWKAMVEPSWAPWPFRSMMSWFSHRDAHGDAWSLCHYWSNFEIANLDFFRNRAYQDMFEYLDRTGKFYTERVSSLLSQTSSLLTLHSGATPPSTLSPLPCSLTRTRYTTLRILATATTGISNALPTHQAASYRSPRSFGTASPTLSDLGVSAVAVSATDLGRATTERTA